MADIDHSIQIAVPANKVYEALTTATGIRSWWTVDADLDQTIGGKGIFRFNYNGIVETVVHILVLQPPEQVTWKVAHSFRPEQDGTLINFTLRPEQDGTCLSLSQEGYAKKDETFALMSKGWAYYFVSLKRYLETGRGAPSPNLDFSIMNNQ